MHSIQLVPLSFQSLSQQSQTVLRPDHVLQWQFWGYLLWKLCAHDFVPGKATVSIYIYVITGILEGLTKIKGEPSIVLIRVLVRDYAGRKDNKRS